MIGNLSVNTLFSSKNLYSFCIENRVTQKVSQVGKNIFSYFSRNQHALQLAVWSCLFIKVSTFMFDDDTHASGMNLDTCQNIVCDIWSRHPRMSQITSPSHNFPSIVNSRCNTSYDSYTPYYFLSSCLDDLCNYMQKALIPFSLCKDYIAQNLTLNIANPKHVFSVIEKICPWDNIKNKDILNQGVHLSICLKQICDYFIHFYAEAENEILKRLCQNPYIESINSISTKLSEIADEGNKKLQENDSWGKNTGATVVIVGMAVTGVSILACWNAGLIIQLKDIGSSTSTSLYSFQQTVGNMLQGASNTLSNVNNIETSSSNVPGEVLPNTELGNMGRQVKDLINNAQELIENSFSYPEEGLIPDEDLQSSFLNTEREELQPVETMVTNEISEEKIYIQKFIDTTLRYFEDASKISFLHLDYLKESFENWHNAFCFYRHRLFCRFPFERYMHETPTSIPLDYFETITLEKLPGLCFSIFNDLWCNWTKAIRMLTRGIDNLELIGYCPSDSLYLEIERAGNSTEFYQMNALGNCYNQTLVVKV